jgi:integrase
MGAWWKRARHNLCFDTMAQEPDYGGGKANVTDTKGMKYRVVPMTKRLREALAAHRHLKGYRVLYTDTGETVTAKVLQRWMFKAQKRAMLKATGGLHILVVRAERGRPTAAPRGPSTGQPNPREGGPGSKAGDARKTSS